MTYEIPPSAFRHLLRVRLGVTGPRGRLRRCDSRQRPGTTYWRVKLDDGQWVLPYGLVLDGEGDRVVTCAECGLPFVTDAEVLCRFCNDGIFGVTERAHEPTFKLRERL